MAIYKCTLCSCLGFGDNAHSRGFLVSPQRFAEDVFINPHLGNGKILPIVCDTWIISLGNLWVTYDLTGLTTVVGLSLDKKERSPYRAE